MRISGWAGKVLYLVVSLVILVFFLFNCKYTYDFPYLDDFDTPVNFLRRLIKNNGIQEKLKIFFEFHSDHRLFNLRVEVLIYYLLFGYINLHTITFINNLFILFSFLIVVKFLNRGAFTPLIVLILALFLFSNSYFTAINWAHVSANYGPVVFFSIAGLLLFEKNGSISGVKLSLIFIFCSIALFSFGNGIISFFSYILLLIYFKHYRKALIFAGFTLLIIGVFFIDYQRATYLEEVHWGVEGLLAKMLGFIRLVGAFSFINDDWTVIPTVTGTVILAVTLLLFYLSFFKKEEKKTNNVYLWAVYIFFLGTLLAIAHGRINNFNELKEAFVDRYRFYSLFALITFVSILFNTINFRTIRYIGFLMVFAALSFNIYSYLAVHKVAYNNYYKKLLVCTENNFINFKRGVYYYQGDDRTIVKSLAEVYEKKLLKFNNNVLQQVDLGSNDAGEVQLDVKTDSVYRRYGKTVFYDRMLFVKLKDLRFKNHNLSGAYLALEHNEGKAYYYPFYQNSHIGRNFVKGGVGGYTDLNMINIPHGLYKVKVLVYNGLKNYEVYSSNEVIRVL